jgi:hypothetical protein
MDWVSFDYKHSLGIKEAGTKLAAASETLGASYKLAVIRKKGQVDLDGKILRGHLQVHKNKISVHIALIGPVTPTKASIETGIRKALDQQFG